MKIIIIIVLFTIASSGFVLYKQCDTRWGSQQLGTCSETICSAGCLMTSLAMALDHRLGYQLTP